MAERSTAVVPPGARTVHFIGDTHFGGLPSHRADKFHEDMDSTLLPVPAARLQLGDFTQAGTTAQSTEALAWADLFTDGAPFYTLVGNHDLWDDRDGATMAAEFGMAGLNYTVDLGFARLVVVGPEAAADATDNTTVLLSASTLTWLDQALTDAGSQWCIVCAHAPLYGTVLGDVNTEHRSDRDGFFVTSGAWADRMTTQSSGITAVLADHDNVLAFVSGHTHSSFDADDLVKSETIGARQVACVNAGAIFYLGKTWEFLSDAIRSVYLTVNADDTIDVRWRNHGGRCWEGPDATRVWTFDPTA